MLAFYAVNSFAVVRALVVPCTLLIKARIGQNDVSTYGDPLNRVVAEFGCKHSR